MSTKYPKETAGHGLGEALFSKTQRQVLSLTFGNPGRSFHAKEIVRYAGVGVGSVQLSANQHRSWLSHLRKYINVRQPLGPEFT